MHCTIAFDNIGLLFNMLVITVVLDVSRHHYKLPGTGYLCFGYISSICYMVEFALDSANSECSSKSFNKVKKEGAHYSHSCLPTLAACYLQNLF